MFNYMLLFILCSEAQNSLKASFEANPLSGVAKCNGIRISTGKQMAVDSLVALQGRGYPSHCYTTMMPIYMLDLFQLLGEHLRPTVEAQISTPSDYRCTSLQQSVIRVVQQAKLQ